MPTGISLKVEKNGRKNYRGIVKRCTRIRKRQKKKKGVQHFTEDGRNAEITVDLVLQAMAKLSDNKVNGLEDAVASEMIKICEMFPGPLYGSDGCSQLVDDCGTGFPVKTRRRTKIRESGVTEQLRSPVSCRSGARLV